MGVGRAGSKYNFYNIGGSLLLIVSLALTIRAGYLLISSEQTEASTPQVLGAIDNAEENKQLYTTYIVKSGDTLFNISKQYAIEWTVLATLNNLQAPFSLRAGQEIKIPQN